MTLDIYLDVYETCDLIINSMPIIKESILAASQESSQTILAVLPDINSQIIPLLVSLEELECVNTLEIIRAIVNGLGILSEGALAGPNVVLGGDGIYHALAEGIRFTAENLNTQLLIADSPSITNDTDSRLNMWLLRFAKEICVAAVLAACVVYNVQQGIEPIPDVSDTASMVSSLI